MDAKKVAALIVEGNRMAEIIPDMLKIIEEVARQQGRQATLADRTRKLLARWNAAVESLREEG